MLDLTLDLFEGNGGGSPPTALPPVPVVEVSTIANLETDAIRVTWDRPMEATGDIRTQLAIVVNGGAAIYPDDVSFSVNVMVLVITGTFASGDVVTWSYDDSGANTLQEIAAPNAEAGIQENVVINSVQATLLLWVDEHSEVWKDEDDKGWII